MSRSREVTLACRTCGTHQSFTVWDSINVSIDPSLKEPLLQGRLTTAQCQQCGNRAHVAHDLLYHDMDRQLAVWLKYPDDEGTFGIEEPAENLFASLADQYVCRLVPSFEELVEKIRLFDERLDDCAIELLKLTICIREGIDVTCPLYFHAIEKSLLGRRSIVFVLSTADDLLEKRYPLKKHMAALQPILTKLAIVRSCSGHPWLHVNREYIMGQLEAAGLMRQMKTDRAQGLVMQRTKAAGPPATATNQARPHEADRAVQAEASHAPEERDTAARLVGAARIAAITSFDVLAGVCPEAWGVLDSRREMRSDSESGLLLWQYLMTIATVGAAHDLALQRGRSGDELAALRDAIGDALYDWEQTPWLPGATGGRRPWAGSPSAHELFLDYCRHSSSGPLEERDARVYAAASWLWCNLTGSDSKQVSALCGSRLLWTTGNLVLRIAADTVDGALRA